MWPPFSFGARGLSQSFHNPAADAGTQPQSRHSRAAMQRYRFITPHRAGKWYPDLETAQRHACKVGAGFLAERTGEFCAYRETRLEVVEEQEAAE